MVKLYNFHLAAISVRPLLLQPAPAAVASTALGWDSVFGLADLNKILTPQISDQVTAVTAMNEKDRNSRHLSGVRNPTIQ